MADHPIQRVSQKNLDEIHMMIPGAHTFDQAISFLLELWRHTDEKKREKAIMQVIQGGSGKT